MARTIDVSPAARRKRRQQAMAEAPFLRVRIVKDPETRELVLQLHRWRYTDFWQRGSGWDTLQEGLAGARRRLTHILENYGLYPSEEAEGEIQKLHEFLAEVRVSVEELSRWNDLTGAEKQQLQNRLMVLAGQFANFRNEYKVLSGEQIAKSALLTDKRGQVNPPAMKWRLQLSAQKYAATAKKKYCQHCQHECHAFYARIRQILSSFIRTRCAGATAGT